MRSSKQMVSVYAPEALEEIRAEAKRLDRTVSWVVRVAWRLAREQVRAIPAPHEAS